jgi:hypothetical protein
MQRQRGRLRLGLALQPFARFRDCLLIGIRATGNLGFSKRCFAEGITRHYYERGKKRIVAGIAVKARLAYLHLRHSVEARGPLPGTQRRFEASANF